MQKKYWRAVFRQAAREAREALRINSGDRLVLAIIGVVIVLLVLGIAGSEGAAFDYSLEKAGIAALILLLFPVWFLWKSVTIPARKDAEKQAEIDKLNEALKPKLHIEYEDDRDFCVLTPVGDKNKGIDLEKYLTKGAPVGDGAVAYYVRVRISNTGNDPIRNCQTYIIKIDEDHNIFEEPMPLAWAARSSRDKAYSKIDLYKGTPQFVDVLAIVNDGGKPTLQVEMMPYRYDYLFKHVGKFTLVIKAVADNAQSEEFLLEFDWQGVWDDFRIAVASPHPA